MYIQVGRSVYRINACINKFDFLDFQLTKYFGYFLQSFLLSRQTFKFRDQETKFILDFSMVAKLLGARGIPEE